MLHPTGSLAILAFSRMHSEGFLFLSGDLGAGLRLPRFRHMCAERWQAFAACSIWRFPGDWQSAVSLDVSWVVSHHVMSRRFYGVRFLQ